MTAPATKSDSVSSERPFDQERRQLLIVNWQDSRKPIPSHLRWVCDLLGDYLHV